ncbi:MAG TPA: hypothetical protein VIR30_18165 [Nocardioides sp.]
MRTKRLALVGASLVLMGGMTAACGGGASGAPDDASEKDFCAAVKKTGEQGSDADKIKDAYEDLVEVGTPKGMPDEARKGFEVFADAIDEADEDDKEAPYEGDKDKEKQVEAYFTYVGETCS